MCEISMGRTLPGPGIKKCLKKCFLKWIFKLGKLLITFFKPLINFPCKTMKRNPEAIAGCS